MYFPFDNSAIPLFAQGQWETSVHHTWPGPSWVIAVLIIVTLTWVYWLYRQENLPVTKQWLGKLAYFLRGTTVAIVIFMLGGWMWQTHRTSRPEVVICIDDSASMATIDGGPDGASIAGSKKQDPQLLSPTTRLDRIREAWKQVSEHDWQQFVEQYDLRWYWISDAARPLVNGDAPRLNSGAEGRSVTASLPVELMQSKPDRAVSRLGDSLIEILRKQNPRSTAAVMVFTDGVNNSGSSLREAAELARRRQIPLHFIGTGSTTPPSDIALRDLVTDEVAFVNDLIPFDARLIASACEGKTVKVRLRRSGSPEALAEQTIRIDSPQAVIPIRLTTRPKEPGEFEYQLQVSLVGGELNEDNNVISRSITVTEKLLRVIMVSSTPNYDFRFLKNLLSRRRQNDASERLAIELTTVLQEADPDYARQDKTAQRFFPTSSEELNQYDVVVFGDADPELLGTAALELLSEFVTDRGGGLIVLSGERFTPLAYRGSPLANLLPIEIEAASVPGPDAERKDGFTPRLAPLGEQMPALQLADAISDSRAAWQELPPWYWYVNTPELRTGATVLAEHPAAKDATGRPLPLITLQFVGSGKVVFHASDETWRWARGAGGEQMYARYWQQILRYLGRARLLQDERRLELHTDRLEYRADEEVTIRLRYYHESSIPGDDEVIAVTVRPIGGTRAEGAASQTITLHRTARDRGRFEAQVGPLREGRYQATLMNPPRGGSKNKIQHSTRDAVASPGSSPSTPPNATETNLVPQNAETDQQRVEFLVVGLNGEQSQLQLDINALESSAKLAAGSYLHLPDWKLSETAKQLPLRRAVRMESLPPQPLWNRWPWALLFVLAITCEWLIRRKLGLV